MNTLIIILGLIIFVTLILKVRYFQHKMYIIFIVSLIAFFYLTGSMIIKENNMNLKSFDGIVGAGKLYFSWLGHAFENSRSILGNVIKMDWVGNSTIK
ncbi:MAG: hypothetical protein KJ559_01215 [Nanoarchaeota archaeon]|nr:hypothetical protein [Nanoarchaeota archaeon]